MDSLTTLKSLVAVWYLGLASAFVLGLLIGSLVVR